MSQSLTLPQPSPVVYPESDGLPMADNTRQMRWIFVLFGNLAAWFRDRPDVFVAGNLYWYPVEGQSEIRIAPDVLVVLGRPPGDRGSYKQWEEGNIPLTVAFEVLSPSNTYTEMDDKLAFYEDYGVEEYYVYDPELYRLKAFVRQGEILRRVRPVQNFVSPRLGIRFDLSGDEMAVYYPDGRRFLTFEELDDARLQEKQRADQEKARADQEKARADQEKARADQAEQRLARLAELSRKARSGQASAEDLQELERLEQPPAG